MTVENIISQKRQSYLKKMKSFLSWSVTKCSMNGTSDKYIRGMLMQIMKELHIPSTLVMGILNSIYIRDFDASRLVNKVYELSKPIFDVLNKDEMIRKKSIESALLALKYCNVYIDGLNATQQAGLCVFVQFVLSGGRNDIEGFGVCTNYVDQWKKVHQSKMKKMYQEKLKKLSSVPIVHYVVDEVEEANYIETSITNANVPDNWEDDI